MAFYLDSDKKVRAVERYTAIKNELAAKQFVLDDQPGSITQGLPKMGAFVLPDNNTEGTLEDLLLESARSIYPELLDSAITFVDMASRVNDFVKKELADFEKPAGQNKAIIGAMTSILKPGKAVQVSIQDNRWLRDQSLSLPRIQEVQFFLKSLFDIP